MWWLSKATDAARRFFGGGGSSSSNPKPADSGFVIKPLHDGLEVVTKQFDDLTPLMQQIGTYLCQVSRVAFANQRWDGKKWLTRKASSLRPSIMGVVADLENGPEIHPNRFKDTPALVVTGNLRRSIRSEASKTSVRVFSTASYANKHNQGGSDSLPVTAAVKANLASLLKTNPALRPALGFLFNASTVSVNIPARPFLGVPQSSMPKINEMAAKFMQQKAEEARGKQAGGEAVGG